MLARQQELNTQFHQLLDALLLASSLFAAHALRFYGTGWLDLPYSIDPFQNYQWLLIVIIPFGPIILDLQGFYQSPFNKTLWKSFIQIVRTMFYLAILVSASLALSLWQCSGQPPGPSRLDWPAHPATKR